MLQAKRMGRKPAGEKKLSNAERQKRYHEKNKEILKEKDKLRKRKSREVYEGFPSITQGKGETRVKKKKRKKAKNTANSNIDEEPLVVNMKFPAVSRILKRAKSRLPKDRAQKRAVVKALFEDTIPVTPRKSKLLSAWSNIYLPKPKVKGRKALLNDET